MQLFEFSIVQKLLTLKSWGIVGVKSGVFNLTSGSQLFRGILLEIQLLHLHPTFLKSVFFPFLALLHQFAFLLRANFLCLVSLQIQQPPFLSLSSLNFFERFSYFIFFKICISVCVRKNGLNYSGCCEYEVTKYSEVYFI